MRSIEIEGQAREKAQPTSVGALHFNDLTYTGRIARSDKQGQGTGAFFHELGRVMLHLVPRCNAFGYCF